jgi:hypothetical protein
VYFGISAQAYSALQLYLSHTSATGADDTCTNPMLRGALLRAGRLAGSAAIIGGGAALVRAQPALLLHFAHRRVEWNP